MRRTETSHREQTNTDRLLFSGSKAVSLKKRIKTTHVDSKELCGTLSILAADLEVKAQTS